MCIGEAFSKLAKYERYSGKWKMLTRNVATYATIPIPQRARAADEELTQNSEPCLNHTQQVESVYRTLNRTRQFTEGFVVLCGVDSITDYNGFSPRRSRE